MRKHINGVTKMLRVHTANAAKTLLLAVAAMGMVGAGCAEPEQIDQTQPNLLAKSMFEGEFHALDTVVRAPYADANAFAGLQSDLTRGVWEIEEKYLYFYRTYEFVEGVESQGIKSDTDSPLLDDEGNPVTYEVTLEDGTTATATRYIFRSSPLRRYSITSHADVRKSYSPLTGEESNVLIEDTSEKFWWERDYIRVNFASYYQAGNVVFQTGFYEGETEPEQIGLRTVEDGSYFDFLVRELHQAPQFYYAPWGMEIPLCVFYAWYVGQYLECGVEEVHVRSAFKKVDPDNTYKPMQYNDHMLGKFGFYRSSRQKWDQFYGSTWSDAIRRVRRFRIWDQYIEGEDGELDYSQMNPQPVVYYLSEEFPRELIPGAIELADQWNGPFSEVAKFHKPEYEGRMFVLCENNLAEVAQLLADDPDAVLAETDETYCKDMDQAKILGDLRYHMLVSINDPTQYPLYGYGPMHSDPITGETIHANAFQYTANMKLGARNAVDMIEYAAGVQSFRDVTQAEHITTKLKKKALSGMGNEPRKSYTVEEAQEAAGMVVPSHIHERMAFAGIEASDVDTGRARMAKLLGTNDFDFVWKNPEMASLIGLPVYDLQEIADYDGMLEEVAHPYHLSDENKLLWGEVEASQLGMEAICMGEQFDDSFRGVAAEYKTVYDKAVCEGLMNRDDLLFDFTVFEEPGDPCGAGFPGCSDGQICTFFGQGEASGKYCKTQCSTGVLLDQLREEIRRVEQISEFAYWDPNALYSNVKDQFVRDSQTAARDIIEAIREEVFAEVYDRIWGTVAQHEVGHNVGLRHNFASSTDALNYFPEYWDIKGTRVMDGSGEMVDWVPNNLFQEDTQEQSMLKMREYQQTSVMEYGGSFNARYQGLGSYDYASIHFGYGEILHAFEETPDFDAWKDYLDEPEDSQPTNYGLGSKREAPMARAFRKLHHTNFPKVFGDVDAISKRKLVKWQDLVLMETVTAEDGSTSQQMKACDMFDDAFDDSVCGLTGSYCTPYPTGFYCSDPASAEVPYRFCSDEYNWTSTTCQTRDEGVDTFEIVNHAIDDYEHYWPFRAYKRDNDLFYPARSYWNSIQGYMAGWRKHFEHWAYNYARYNAVTESGMGWWEERYGMPWHLDVNGGLGDTLAAKDIFEQFANIFGRPSDGWYGWNEQRDRYEPWVDNGRNTYCNEFQVREDTGARPMYSGYDFSGYIYTPSRAGTFYDRLAALMWMTNTRMMFVAATDTAYDVKRFRFSFNDVWPQRMQNLLSGLVTSDPVPFGWCIEHDNPLDPTCGNAEPLRVKPRKWFGTDEELEAHYYNCVPLTPEPEYSFPTTQYRLPALASLYGLINMSGSYDRTFTDRMRMWLEGEAADVSVPDGFETLSYTDPFSGKTYVAPFDPVEFDPAAPGDALDSLPYGDFEMHGNNYWPSAWLVNRANVLLDEYGGNMTALSNEYQYSELQQIVGRLEILRGLYRRIEFGY